METRNKIFIILAFTILGLISFYSLIHFKTIDISCGGDGGKITLNSPNIIMEGQITSNGGDCSINLENQKKNIIFEILSNIGLIISIVVNILVIKSMSLKELRKKPNGYKKEE